MPTVREILFGSSARAQSPAQGIAATVTTAADAATSVDPDREKKAKQQLKPGDSDMADRIREAAQRRTDLARLEVQRRQEEVRRHEERVSESEKHGLPVGEAMADRNEAMQRLNESRANLVRAEEAQFNTELTTANRKGLEQGKVTGPDAKLEAPKKIGDMIKPGVKPTTIEGATRGVRAG